MATATLLRSAVLLDRLDCSICYEKFHVPKTLPCLHSFCEQCLCQYISSKRDHWKLGGFHCPTCREFIHVPDLSHSLTSWGKQFRTNFHLRDLVEAETQAMAGQAFCSHHPGKTIELYCSKCACALCSMCVVEKHQQCGEIESLDNGVCNRRSNLELLRKQLKRSVDISTNDKDKAGKYVKELEQYRRVVTAEVKDWERKVMYSIMKQTKILLADVQTSIAKEISDVLKWLSSNNGRIQDSATLLKNITQVLEENDMSPVEFLTSGVELENRSTKMLDNIAGAALGRSTLTFKKAEWTLGNCAVGHVIFEKTSPNPHDPCEGGRAKSCSILGEAVSLVKEINCLCKEDKKEACLQDLIVLCDSNMLVVTDSNNNCVKGYRFVDEGAITCRLAMLKPRCLAVVAVDKFVLTTESRNVYFFDVRRLMTMESRIQIGFWYERKSCYGITRLSGDCLAVSFTNHPGIDVVTYTGTPLRTIRLPEVHLSSYLSTGDGLLAVSCPTTGTVLVLDSDGDVMCEETRDPSKCCPGGVDCDGKLVLYADSKDVSMNELVGNVITPLIAGKSKLHCPRSVFLSGTENLYVADKGTVKLFHYRSWSYFTKSEAKSS